jgi:hypothetical protein
VSEDHFKNQDAKIKALEDAEEIRLKEESEREEKRRVQVLKDAGMMFGGFFYEIGENISLDVPTIKAMPIEEFEKRVYSPVPAELKRKSKYMDEDQFKMKYSETNMMRYI